VQRLSVAVPSKVALVIVPETVPLFVFRVPLILALVHSISFVSSALFDVMTVLPMFVPMIVLPVASAVPVGCVSVTAEAGVADTANAAKAASAMRAAMSFFDM
jgi:hypothetical protein